MSCRSEHAVSRARLLTAEGIQQFFSGFYYSERLLKAASPNRPPVVIAIAYKNDSYNLAYFDSPASPKTLSEFFRSPIKP